MATPLASLSRMQTRFLQRRTSSRHYRHKGNQLVDNAARESCHHAYQTQVHSVTSDV